ncbi:ribose-phosphate diphosphokinase [Microbispora siamensis]|uniref:ribose-phosphate diphosphokinase n=1 Tax=Microbispora siamensis TaxID=564413 RepID=A0ABQ4GTR4_9ACTN|nr:ribose-phosphate diphosphokinase [Microbispora siamensis]GIH64838.1 ribose-phosphate pyrophosphokinase [Microbispora siamensis]
MTLRIVAGTANRPLAAAVAAALDQEPSVPVVERFPDGESRPVVTGVRGADVYLIQPTGPPVNEHVMEALLLADACRRGGAARLTAVVPYVGYARQERRRREGEAIGLRVVVAALASAGVERLIAVDPHTAALEAVCPMPVETLTAAPALARAAGRAVPEEAVVVAPDLGAVTLARHYARLLERPVALVRKKRLTGADVRAEQVFGDVTGRPALVVDDMISTGATIEATAEALLAQGAAPPFAVAATHGLFAGDARERLRRTEIRGLIRGLVVTDTLPQDEAALPSLEVCPVAPLLAGAIGRLHRDEGMDDLLAGT